MLVLLEAVAEAEEEEEEEEEEAFLIVPKALSLSDSAAVIISRT